MRIFYLIWFFVCAGWGYLAATMPSDIAPQISQLPRVMLGGAAFAAMLLAADVWRARSGNGKLSRPTLSLPPWIMPVGFMLFLGLSFLFIGGWGVLFGMLGAGALEFSLYVLALSAGLLLALVLVPRLFSNAFAR